MRISSSFQVPSLLLCAILALSSSCKKETGSQSSNDSDVSDTDGKDGPAAPTVRSKLVPHRALLSESSRAELSMGGLLVDLGTGDQHKFTRGGWRTSWGPTKNQSGVTYSEIIGNTARLEGHGPGPVSELLIRARSKVPGQKLSAWVDGTMRGSAPLTAKWSVVRMPVKGVDKAGRREILLRLGAKTKKADIDWVWLAETAGAEAPAIAPRVASLNLGRPKRALVAPSARDFRFYLDVPEKASLVFDYGSNNNAMFSVFAETDGGKKKKLFGPTTAKGWTEANVDLSAYAGKTVRLTLETKGDGGGGWGEPEIMQAIPEPEVATGGKKAKNVIVILIDTVRADSFAPFFPKNKVVTPSYDALAKKSTVFVNAYNNENWTKPSVATTLTGVYPSTHQTKKDGSKLPKDVRMLSEHFKAAGFSTGGFVANGYVSGAFGFEKGWDVFKNYIRIGKPSEAEHVYKDAKAFLDANKSKGRFFLYIQTIDPHVVYRVGKEYTKHYYPGEYKGILGSTIDAKKQLNITNKKIPYTENDLKWLKAMYWGEVTYHDDHMGRFIAELEKAGMLKDTAIVVTNDHGEELLEHGRIGHGHSLYDELLRAPMLVHHPPMFSAGKEITDVVENVDLAATITDIAGVKPMAQGEGKSLVPLAQGREIHRPTYAVSEFLSDQRAARVGRWKFIRTAGNRAHLFDVVADRTEKNDVLKKKPIARRLVELHLGEGLAIPAKDKRQFGMTTKQQFKAGEAQWTPELKRQMEALGYMGDGER